MPATKQNTTESAKHKLSLIRLAEELGNVSKACEITGYSRQSFPTSKTKPKNKPHAHQRETPNVK